MFQQVAKQCVVQASRKFSTTRANNFQVTVCGAGGGIGQPLSLLLKLNPLVTRLNLYDIVRTVGVAADLSHIDTQSEVVGYEGKDKCGESLKCSDVIVISAGVPRKPGMTRDDLFDMNASIVKTITKEIAKHCPNGMICIVTNPVNSMVPIAAEVLKKKNVFNPKRLFGVTTLDLVRSRKFIGDALKVDPKNVKINVICGHSGPTIIPVFSDCDPKYDKNVEKTTKRIQTAGDEVLKAKAGGGTATLSMAYSAAIFTDSLLKALNGKSDIVECTFVHSDVCETGYFAIPVVLGKEGIEKQCEIPNLNDFEKELLTKAIPGLEKSIARGAEFGKKSSDVVIISAGIPRKPGMTRDDLFNVNAGIVRDIVEEASKKSPKALIAIITNPVNTLVPIAAEILKKNGVYDPRRLFGVTTLDVVRSRAFVGHELGSDPQKVEIPVIGGHSGVTIMPIFSQSKPKYDKNIDALTKRVQDAGTEVVKAKAGEGSATLSMAYAGALFGKALLRGLNGESNVVECAYVQSDVTEAAFFSTPILLGKNGLEKNLGLPNLSDYEKKVLAEAIPELKKNIDKGIKFGKN